MMHVPNHISVIGEGGQVPSLNMGDAVNVAQQMNVPDRILLAGGNRVRADRAPPTEVMADRLIADYPTEELASPPSTITLDKATYPDIPEEVHPSTPYSQVQDESMSLGSIAIEENPLQEMKNMRRQIGRLSTRILNLEDDFERRKNREMFLWFLIIAETAGILAALVFKKSIK